MHNISLHFFELCSLSRQVKLLLEEQNIPYNLISYTDWSKDFLGEKFSYLSQLPKISISDEIISGWYSVLFHLEEKTSVSSLLGKVSKEKNIIKQIISYMNDKFYNIVIYPLIKEKVISYINNISPDSREIRKARHQSSNFLKFIDKDLQQYHCLSHNDFSAADLIAASHISVLDYLNEIEWSQYNSLKTWYSIIKSRPSMKKILDGKIQGFVPPPHYQNPDF